MRWGSPGHNDWVLWTEGQQADFQDLYADNPLATKFSLITDLLNLMDPNDGPTAYEIVDPDALRRCHSRNLQSQGDGFLHWEVAVENLETFNHPNRPLERRQRGALARLKALGSLDRWYPDIFMKIFLDVDTLLFHDSMRDDVYIGWTCEPHEPALAYCAPPGHDDNARVSICFNIHFLARKTVTVHEAIMVVIHEMCHAYTMVHCDEHGGLDRATMDRRNLRQGRIDHWAAGHGIAFTRCPNAVQARLGPTRYIHMAKLANTTGGSVARSSPLGQFWDDQGGFCRSEAKLSKRLREAERQLGDANRDRSAPVMSGGSRGSQNGLWDKSRSRGERSAPLGSSQPSFRGDSQGTPTSGDRSVFSGLSGFSGQGSGFSGPGRYSGLGSGYSGGGGGYSVQGGGFSGNGGGDSGNGNGYSGRGGGYSGNGGAYSRQGDFSGQGDFDNNFGSIGGYDFYGDDLGFSGQLGYRSQSSFSGHSSSRGYKKPKNKQRDPPPIPPLTGAAAEESDDEPLNSEYGGWTHASPLAGK